MIINIHVQQHKVVISLLKLHRCLCSLLSTFLLTEIIITRRRILNVVRNRVKQNNCDGVCSSFKHHRIT